MIASLENLQDFNAFAHECLTAGQTHSMRDLFKTWLAMREQNEVVADMQASDVDIAAGNVTPLDEAMAQVRASLGINK